MSKKNWTAGLFALALTLGIVSVAAAAGPSLADPSALSGSTFAPLGAAAGIGPQDPPNPPGPRGGPGRGPLRGRPLLSGEITAIGDNQFTLTTAGNNEVTVVGSDTLAIETRRGETFTFDVTADTDFLSRDNSVTGLAEIEAGDHVMVLFEQSDSGGLTANVIF